MTGLERAVKAVGGVKALARLLGITPAAVYQWEKIPTERLLEVERVTGVPREVLRPEFYCHLLTTSTPLVADTKVALAIVKAAAYRVSKPRAKKAKGRVGPTFVAHFADGQMTRMSTFTSLEKLDVERGIKLSHAAYETRRRLKQTGTNAVVPPIVSAHFEQDDKVLATY